MLYIGRELAQRRFSFFCYILFDYFRVYSIIMQRILFSLLVLCSISCVPKGESIVYESIKAHRFDEYLPGDSIFYHKTTQVYDSLGVVKKVLEQDHLFFPSSLYYQISSRDSSGLKLQVKDGQGYYQIQNGIYLKDSISVSRAKSSIETALFVFWQPIKLDDPKARFSYLGKEILLNEKEVHAVELSYPESKSTDEWVFYFDTSTLLNLGYRVRHNGKLSLIINEAFHQEDENPILVHKRSSYLVLDTMLRLQADYVYELIPD